MSDQMDRPSSQPMTTSRTHNPAIEEILLYLFPNKVFMDSVASIASLSGQQESSLAKEFNAQIETQRGKLLAMTQGDLGKLRLQIQVKRTEDQTAHGVAAQAKKDAKAATKDAAKFYNQANAQAEFNHWTKMEYWTFDEAIALLLGKEPTVVTWVRVSAAIESERGLSFIPGRSPLASGFLLTYEKLRDLALRASAMNAPHLKPTDVIEWANKVNVVEIPEQLLQLLRSGPTPRQDFQQQIAPSPPERTFAPPPTDSLMDEKNTGQATRWTGTKLEELKTYREQHGTAKAAKHFGISDTRVRQLLPQERPQPTNNNPFNIGRR